VATRSNTPQDRVSFKEFDFDCSTRELKKNGQTVRLEPQPAKVLAVLVRNAGDVVTRQELIREVWGSDTFVDFDQGLNYAIRRVRAALDDDADVPCFLETIPKLGYRFVAEVSRDPGLDPPELPVPREKKPRRHVAIGISAIIALALIVAGAAVIYHRRAQETQNKINSLAVLPLRNLSKDSDQEYFSEGMTDELITILAKQTGMRVISHTSVERYKDTKRALPEIARELGVGAIVEGTVMRSGEHVRITAQLIDAQHDQHVWAESYEGDLRDVFALQEEVARQIANEIGIKLIDAGAIGTGAPKRKVDPVAYESYLKGRSYFNHMSCHDFEDALAYFQLAVHKDPKFAAAYSGTADAYFTLGNWRCVHEEHFDEAEIAATRAIELEPGNAQAYAVLGEVGFSRDWNWVGPVKQFTTAIDLDPNDPNIHSYYGMFLVAMGKVEEGIAEERKAQELDPFSDRTNLMYTWTLYLAHRFDEAIAQANHALSISPSYGEYYWLGQCYEKKGMPDQAIAFYLKTMSGVPEEIPIRLAAYRKGGLAEYWREDELIRNRNNQKVDPIRQAMYYAHTGEKGKAIEQLQLAYRQHTNGLQFLKTEPVYDGLREDPRFKELLVRLGM
jgi:TolB-like protein/DNA-binding winged helix-turn-helix (wHTH) protein/Tfp pilus assembly protein PilF